MGVQEIYMQRCLQLAKNGLGTTYPNPLVGAVIVYKDKIIGEGWHYQSGLPHAEINAINSVKDKSLLQDSTLYVNLEPCSHYGKTPPCSLAIIENKIPRVVIGTRDYAAHVNGKGIELLKNNGVEITENILKEECLKLNKRFFTFHKNNRPYIILKWAETTNGFFSPEENSQKWITSKQMKYFSHLWRKEEQAILVGKNTLKIDNPELNARYFKAIDPVKISIGSDFEGLENTHFFRDKSSVLYDKSNFKNDFTLTNILKDLKEKNIQSVIIEGGIKTLESFIVEDLWDEAKVIRSKNNYWENGRKSPTLKNEILINTLDFKDDLVYIFKNKNNIYL